MLPTTHRRCFTAFCAAVAGSGSALAITACGNSLTLKHHRLAVAVTEYRLRPDRIVAPPGTLTVTVDNVGRLTHNLVIARSLPSRGVSTTTARITRTSTVALRGPDLAPGQATTLTVTLPPGHYKLASTVGTDASLGAEGTLTVASK